MLICPEASNAQNNMAAVSADGSTVCVLILRLNSSCSRSIALVVRALRHWLGGKRVKVKSRSPASSRLLATASCLSRHLRMKTLRCFSISSGVFAARRRVNGRTHHHHPAGRRAPARDRALPVRGFLETMLFEPFGQPPAPADESGYGCGVADY